MTQRIVVHAGLPKTGTSAVQEWLRRHRAALRGHGIHYPQHDVDANLVGPGNVYKLLAKDAQGRLDVAPTRVGATLRAFTKSSLPTLLLSSEFFSGHLREISDALPGGTAYILYVRDLLESIESGYNQAVKRGTETATLSTEHFRAGGPRMLPYLRRLPGLIEHGLDLRLRPYHRELFDGGDLLHDLFATAELELPNGAGPLLSSGSVNPSYTLTALEFKRAANGLPLREVRVALDVALQRCPVGPSRYTLISPEERARLLSLADRELRWLAIQHGITALEPLRAAMGRDEGKPYHPQRADPGDLHAVAEHLQHEAPETLDRVRKIAQEHPEVPLAHASFRDAIA